MPRGAATHRTVEQFRPAVREPSFGGGPPSSPVPPPVSNARLGMLMLIGAETMLFAGLIGAYVVFRFGSTAWPSASLYLPVGVTWVNTFVLLSSCYTMHRAIRAVRVDHRGNLVRHLAVTALLGVVFLSVQGYEWAQLVRDGLTISTGVYGATFYTLIGCHAVHVLAAVLWLLVVLWQATRGRFSSRRSVAVEICAMYWYYVGALWVVLFVLVYLN
ncbi:MAG: cytochrome c oxidase subunit 3 [Thermodesulfobacteriota bacterium]